MSDSEQDVSRLEKKLFDASESGDLATVTSLCQKGINTGTVVVVE